MAKDKKDTKSKEEKLDLVSKLEARFGKGSITPASSEAFAKVKDITSTGSLTLDLATKIGGIPKGGLLTHILGKESSSKTTLSLHIIANEQKKGKPCAFVDVEGTFDRIYAESVGVNLDMLYLVDQEMLLKHLDPKFPDKKPRKVVSGEEWLDVVIGLLQMQEFGIIVLDSVAALTPLSEIVSGVSGGGQMARVGAMLSRAMRNVNATLTTTDAGLIFLNQYRINPGTMYGSPYQEVGGEALKYYTALKIELSRSLDSDDNGVYGIKVTAKVTKSKVGIPFGKGNYYVEFGKGIQRDQEVMALAIERGIIQKTGGWYQLPDVDNKIQGEASVLEFLQANPEYMAIIEGRLTAILNADNVIETVKPEDHIITPEIDNQQTTENGL